MTSYTKYSTECHQHHVALDRMDFFRFLVVHNSESEAERYSTVMLQTKLKYGTQPCLYFESKMFITDLPQFQSQPETRFREEWSHRTVCGDKYWFSKSPDRFIASIDIDLFVRLCNDFVLLS